MLSLVAAATAILVTAPRYKTENVVLLMTDGLRWQEVFRGAKTERLAMLGDSRYKQQFGQATPEARRAALMPFLWGVVAKKGQIYGNADVGSNCVVINGLNFSYPGYNETLCGYPDSSWANTNNPVPNRNVTVFEWLNRKQAIKGHVAAFGAWSVLSSIFNRARCGFPVNSGYEPAVSGRTTPAIEQLNRLKAEQPRQWVQQPFDAIPFLTAKEYMKVNHPRLLFVGLGETDEWAHEARYGHYLTAAHRFDAYVRELWDSMQKMPQYHGKTTFIITCDHGRGEGELWTSHGRNIPASKNTWIGILGPDTPALGEVQDGPSLSNGQIAATIAKLLGYDYVAEQGKAAPAISSAFRSGN
jgi:hypothetical protein